MQEKNKNFSTVPNELEASSEIREVIENASNFASSLMSSFEGDRLNRVSLSASLLWEYIIKTDWRYHDLLLAVKEFNVASKKDDRSARTRQLQYVDRTEAYHRQIYGTLSVLLLFLSHAAPRRIVSQLPISSVQKFLKFLHKQPKLVSCSEHFDQLLSSVKYRASFLDHPQQSKLHHWMTIGLPTETVIIHYIPTYVEPIKNDGEISAATEIQYLNPRAPNFKPIIACSSFAVSPEIKKTHVSLCSTILCVLEWCNKANGHETT